MTRPHDILNYPLGLASIAAPLWMPSIQTLSQFAALLIPIFVCVYWALMIGLKLFDRYRGKRP